MLEKMCLSAVLTVFCFASACQSTSPPQSLASGPRSQAESCQAGATLATPGLVQVEKWPNGAKAAISLTIDEGLHEPYELLMPEIELRHWRATFYIYTLQPTLEKAWDHVRAAHQRGHEVSNHTHTHPNMTKLDAATVRSELETGNAELKKHLGFDLPLQSFAYPYEATNPEVSRITLEYHRYNRAGDHGAPTPPYPINDAYQPDFGALKAKAPTRSVSLADWNRWTDATVQSGGWFIEELHGVEDIGASGGWEPRTLDEFRKHFDHIESYGRDIWVAPVQNVGNYIEERQSAKINLQKWDKTGIVFTLEDAFQDLKEPLSLLVKIPEGMPNQNWSAQQGKTTLKIEAVETQYVRLQAIPNEKEAICLIAGSL